MREKTGIGGELRHGVASGVSCETSLNKHVTPHLHGEYKTEAEADPRGGREAAGTALSAPDGPGKVHPSFGGNTCLALLV